ncbi:class I SAM-dependent methyltransferase [Maridesulfovibrio frigidus]|uniref:class I SAM-dependent methyltransferase n=1 Tax=Maridesulfovibrio frigidus TaxID=340956 RepID=UPI0004E0C5B3|nr:class I SAM-dependent methyltransferase [Maridesulfovibrio frigidus]
MPNQISDDIKLNLLDIDRDTGISGTELELTALRLSLIHTDENNNKMISRSDLTALFEAHFKGREYSYTFRLPRWLETCDVPWCNVLRDFYKDPVTRPASLSPQQGEFIRSLIVNFNPKTVVEIGVFLGISTLWVAGALEDADQNGKLYSLDLFRDILPKPPTRTKCVIDPFTDVSERIKRAGLDDIVTFVKGDSKQIGANWKTYSTDPIDVLFIDGDHTIPGCLGDFEAFREHLNEEALIILHDIFPENCSCDGPRYLIDMLNKIGEVQIFELETSPHNFGMAVIKLKKRTKSRNTVLE